MANNGNAPSSAPGFIPVTEANLPKRGILGFGGSGGFTKLFIEILKNRNNTTYLVRLESRLNVALTINKTPIMAGKGLSVENENKTQVLLYLTKMFINKKLCDLNDVDGCKKASHAAFLGSGLCEGKKNYVFAESKKLFDLLLPVFRKTVTEEQNKEINKEANEILRQFNAVVGLEATAGMPQPPTGTPARGTGLGGARRRVRRTRRAKKSKRKTRKH